jgi:hypothetical protein
MTIPMPKRAAEMIVMLVLHDDGLLPNSDIARLRKTSKRQNVKTP